jgi:hypothetical protein
MSEHRSNSAQVIALPLRQDDEESWPPALLEKMSERLLLLIKYIESGYLGVDGLMSTQKEIFELVELYFSGLPPRKAAAVVEQIAPQWAEWNRLVESNQEMARTLLARRRANGR